MPLELSKDIGKWNKLSENTSSNFQQILTKIGY